MLAVESPVCGGGESFPRLGCVTPLARSLSICFLLQQIARGVKKVSGRIPEKSKERDSHPIPHPHSFHTTRVTQVGVPSRRLPTPYISIFAPSSHLFHPLLYRRFLSPALSPYRDLFKAVELFPLGVSPLLSLPFPHPLSSALTPSFDQTAIHKLETFFYVSHGEKLR